MLSPDPRHPDTHQRLSHAGHALDKTRAFLMRIHTDPASGPLHQRHLDVMHALDHLFRLSHRCQQDARVRTLQQDPALRVLASDLRAAIRHMRESHIAPAEDQALQHLQAYMEAERERTRRRMVEQAADRDGDSADLLQKLDALRWLQRVSFHLWRIVHHLQDAQQQHDRK